MSEKSYSVRIPSECKAHIETIQHYALKQTGVSLTVTQAIQQALHYVDKELRNGTADMQKEEKRKTVMDENLLAKALGEMPGAAPKDESFKKNGKVEYQYSSADSIFQTVRPHLNKQGLSVWQSQEAFEMLKLTGKYGEENWAQITYAMALVTNPEKPPVPEKCREAYCTGKDIQCPEHWRSIYLCPQILVAGQVPVGNG